jgi:hypothetical protein
MGRFLKETEDRPAVYELIRVDDESDQTAGYRLGRRFRYIDDRNDRTFVVPKNLNDFKTDLASIPFFATWLVPKDGIHTPAALLHDAVLREQNDGAMIGAHQADTLFRLAMWDLGVAFLRRWMMWAAVSLRTLFLAGTWRRGLYAPLIIVMALSSLLLSFLVAGDLLHTGEAWRPPCLEGRVADLLPWLVFASLPLWLKWIGVGAIATAAALVFAVPLALAFLGFVVYVILEYVVKWFFEAEERLPVPSPQGPINRPRVFRLRPRPASYDRIW